MKFIFHWGELQIDEDQKLDWERIIKDCILNQPKEHRETNSHIYPTGYDAIQLSGFVTNENGKKLYAFLFNDDESKSGDLWRL